MRAAHPSDPEDDCAVGPTSDVPYVWAIDEKFQLDWLASVGIGVDGVAGVKSLGTDSEGEGSCGVKMELEMVDENAVDADISGSKRSLSRLIVSST